MEGPGFGVLKPQWKSPHAAECLAGEARCIDIHLAALIKKFQLKMILLVLPCLVHKFFNFPGKHIMIQPHSIWLHLENNKRKPQPNYWDSSSASGKFALMYSCGPFALSHADLNWVTDKTCTGTSIKNKCWANAWSSLSQTSGTTQWWELRPQNLKGFYLQERTNS